MLKGLNYAIASGHNNNCIFHCFIHSIFDQPKDTLAAISKTEGWKGLFQSFREYYNLDDSITDEDILDFIDEIDAPYDREILLGDVLRHQLRKLDDTIGLDEEIYADKFHVLSSLYKIDLIVAHERPDIEPPKPYGHAPDNIYTLTLQHAGNHYNWLMLGDNLEVRYDKHNDYYEKENDQYYVIDQELSEAMEVVGAEARKAKIQEVVQSAFEEPEFTLTAKVGPKAVHEVDDSLEALSLPMDMEHESQAKQKQAKPKRVGFAVPVTHLQKQKAKRDQKREGSDELEMKLTAHAHEAIAETEDDKEDKQKIILDELTKLPKAFVDQTPVIFPEEEGWEISKKEGQIEVKNGSEFVSVHQEPDGVNFKCDKNNMDKMLTWAKAYRDSISQAYDVEYELKANNENTLVSFLQKMDGQGFDITKVTDIYLKGEKLDESKRLELLAKAKPALAVKEEEEAKPLAESKKGRKVSRGKSN